METKRKRNLRIALLVVISVCVLVGSIIAGYHVTRSLFMHNNAETAREAIQSAESPSTTDTAEQSARMASAQNASEPAGQNGSPSTAEPSTPASSQRGAPSAQAVVEAFERAIRSEDVLELLRILFIPHYEVLAYATGLTEEDFPDEIIQDFKNSLGENFNAEAFSMQIILERAPTAQEWQSMQEQLYEYGMPNAIDEAVMMEVEFTDVDDMEKYTCMIVCYQGRWYWFS